MVKDYGRAEDITQEVFVSALRRMRQTERPIAFKPWIYEIAKNACIDAYRRGRRAEEVSYDADDRLSPSDHVRLVATGPEPDAAVDTKQDLEHLCGAFGGLSESHHEILVLRELDGLSYKDIGERMGMSRPAVESTLFRARKRLGEEYDELASGARCLRIQADHRRRRRPPRPARPAQAGAPSLALPAVPAARRARTGWTSRCPSGAAIAEQDRGSAPAARVPAVPRQRRRDFALGGSSWMVHMPSFADSMSSGWSKGAAGLAALLLAGAGASSFAGADKRDERGTGYRATDARTAGASDAATPRRAVVAAGKRPATSRARRGATRRRVRARRRGHPRSAAARIRTGRPARTAARPIRAAAAAPSTGAPRRSRRSRRTLPRPRLPTLRRSTPPFPCPACRRRSKTSATRFPTSTRRSRPSPPSCPWTCPTRRRSCPR